MKMLKQPKKNLRTSNAQIVNSGQSLMKKTKKQNELTNFYFALKFKFINFLNSSRFIILQNIKY